MKRILLFKDKQYLEYPFDEKLEIENIVFNLLNNEVYYSYANKANVKMLPQEKHRVENIEFMLLSDDSITYEKGINALLLGQKNCDIEIKTGRFIIDNHLLICDCNCEVYLNGILQKDKKVQFEYGDQILIDTILIVIYDGYIRIIANIDNYRTDLPFYHMKINDSERFPEYHRSPRVIKRLKNDKITIQKPPTKITRKKNSLVKVIVPPTVMALGTVAMSLMMGRGMYMLIGLAGTTVSLVFSVTAFFSEKKEIKEKKIKREEVYNQYLLGIRKKLDTYKQSEIEALHYNHPTMNEIANMIHEYNPRIYERDVNDDDFLTLSVGTTTDKSEYSVSLDYDVLETEKDELLDEAKEIYNEYQKIENKPVTIDLKKAHLGIVGEKHEVHEQLKWILSQITFFHSYHDVQVITIYNEQFKEDFDYIKWYPHVKIQANNLTGNIYSERVRDQVLGSLHQILKDRKNKRDENKKEMSFLPHFVIIIDDYHMIMNHSIMEYLQEETSELGFSLIYTAQKRANLPENIKTVLMMEDIDTATLLINEGEEVNKLLAEQRIGNVDLELMARDLSALNHIQGMSSHIPESITFLDMYKANTLEELNIPQRWEKGESHKSLAVPLGLRAEDDIVELNLHEKAHGPHGLVAGTTGSGKSETIQTYILSLAVNFSPYEVGFLLIDYKGGGMANLFKKLPHLLGTITNLDGAESMRALESIKAELSRRQRIFNDHEVNNINKYNKLFKNGNAKEPLPHLFIISDEFAELKKEQPEFMSELVSVARIGRTLGVHLILATQKPTGVVDDQIWSNSKFKLALKVQNESDSKEIIKTPDAAFITQTGRGYLQVGNNEIYELFQTAWSGANYLTEAESEKIDDRIYKINLLGQGELINKDLSSDNTGKDTTKSQLDAIVDFIDDYYHGIEHQEVTKPWLPSLAKNIASPYIDDIKDISSTNEIDLTAHIGLIDIPEEQKQIDYSINFIKDGNLAIFSSSGFGKSTTIGTIMLSLAVKNNPQLLNYYVLDFGNSSLIPYKTLPHVADYMTFDSEEKLNKFQKIITAEIKARKQLFGQEMVQNFDMYNQMHKDKPLKAIFMIIDNFDVVKEISMDFEDFITKTTRDGFGLGIYTIITATRSNAVRFSILNNFKNKVVQYLFDEGDVMGLLGRSKYKLNDEVKGRALIKHKYISLMQVYAPIKFEDDVEFITNLKSTIQNVADKYTGEKLIGIPVLPDIFTTKDFVNYKYESTNENLIGLSLDNVESVSADLSDSPYLVVGPSKSGKTNFLEILMSQNNEKAYVFDSDSMALYKYREKFDYINNDEEVQTFIEELTDEIEDRKDKLEDALNSGEYGNPKEFYKSLPSISIYIDDVDQFIQKVQNIPNIVKILEQSASAGIHIIAGVNSAKLKGFDEVSKFFKNATSGAVLGQMGALSMFPINMRDIPTFGYAILCNNGELRKIKLPKFIES